MNDFVKRTADVLGLSVDDPLLAPQGFDIAEDDLEEEPCVLIMGLNPAGNGEDAERERNDSSIYFYGLEGKTSFSKKWMYNSYYLPIFRFVNAIFGGTAKWPWCNMPWTTIEKELNAQDDFPLKNEKASAKTKQLQKERAIKEIEVFYSEHQQNQKRSFPTIYIGDMFYYHETDSKKLPLDEKEGGPDYKAYCNTMLKKHIEKLQNEHHKHVLFVYINNAKVSHWLCDDNRTWIDILGIKVFLGSMLSGQRCMDTFSTNRLIAEIKSNLDEKSYNS